MTNHPIDVLEAILFYRIPDCDLHELYDMEQVEEGLRLARKICDELYPVKSS